MVLLFSKQCGNDPVSKLQKAAMLEIGICPKYVNKQMHKIQIIVNKPFQQESEMSKIASCLKLCKYANAQKANNTELANC